MAGHEGTYWNESDSLLRTIEVREGKLHYVRSAENATELGALEDGGFFMVGIETPVRIEFQASGKSRTMTVKVDDEEPLLFKTLPVLSKNVLSTYTGAYWSAELQRELQIRVEGNEITASWADDVIRINGTMVSTDDVLFPQFVLAPWYHSILTFPRNRPCRHCRLSR